MWDDYSDYGYSDYSYDYPSYDYSSYSSPSYDYSSYYSTPSYDYSSYYSTPSYDTSNYNGWDSSSYDNYSDYDYNGSNYNGWDTGSTGATRSMADSYMPSYDQSATQYDSNAFGGESAQYDPNSYNNYSQQADTQAAYNQIQDAFSQPQLPAAGPATQFAGPADYGSMNHGDSFDAEWNAGMSGMTPTSGGASSYDAFGNPVAAGSSAATSTGYEPMDNSEIGGGFNPGQGSNAPTATQYDAYGNYTGSNTQPYNYTSGSQVGPVMPGDTQPYMQQGAQTRGLSTNTGYGQQQVNSGYQNPAQGYGGGYQQAGAGAGLYGGVQGGQQQQKATGWDWNHPIDSLTNMFTGGGAGGTGAGTGGASGGIFDWLGNNVGGLAAGAAGLYALNKLMDSDSGSSAGVNPTAGYGAVGGAIPVKPGTPLVTPGVNPGYAIGQNGIQGLPKPPQA